MIGHLGYQIEEYFGDGSEYGVRIIYIMEDTPLGTADEIHNCAVPYAKGNMYDCACIILKRGLGELDAAIDLLADYIRYGIGVHFRFHLIFYWINLIERVIE